jgi:hypothetical protein
MSYVTRRKRVVVVDGKELDLGVYRLSDWLQPDCYAVSKLLIDKVMEKWLKEGGGADPRASH